MSGSVPARRDRRSRRLFLFLLCWGLALASQAPSFAERLITRVDVRPVAHHTIIALFTSDSRPLKVKSFSLDDPARLVFDLPGARLDEELASTVSVPTPAIHQIRLGQFQTDPDIARLVVDLNEDLPPPECETAAGDEPGETTIILRAEGPALLRPPTVEAADDAVLVRIADAGSLARSVGVLHNPFRVYADLKGAVLESSSRQEIAEGAVREIRMGQQPTGPAHPVARIVVELRREQAYVFFSDGADLVVAVGPHAWGLPLPDYQSAGRLKGKRIVVDPGHGGHDVGAPAVFRPQLRGPFEKDIVLDIAHRLARVLEAEGAEVTMTREDDTFVSLRERAAIANRLKADAFISVHCNSCDNPGRLCGTSVYYDHRHSAGFAKLVQNELLAALGTNDSGVRNANFAVIRRTKGPGILVETAYINHTDDRARLSHPNFRERAARAIARGVEKFLSDRSTGRKGRR